MVSTPPNMPAATRTFGSPPVTQLPTAARTTNIAAVGGLQGLVRRSSFG